ncbi:MAG TPA: sulfatase-like hydrolase/transferase, partial [Acidimicrobiia bacterium]
SLDLLGKNASVFVTDRASRIDIALLVIGILVVPAAIAYAAEVLIGIAIPRARVIAHAVFIGAFFAVYIEETLKEATKLGPVTLEVLAALLAIGVVVLVVRVVGVRRWLRVLAVAPFVFVAVFVAFSPVSSILFGSTPKGLAGAAITKPKRVVMVVMDEFPLESLLDGTGHVDAALFPNFAALAKTTTWYRNDTSVAPFTEWAVPAIDSAQYPHNPGALPTYQDYPNTIFRLLGGAYRMHVQESITQLCPTSICNNSATSGGVPGQVGKLARSTQRLWSQFASPHRTAGVSYAPPPGIPPQLPSALQWVNGLEPSTRPTLDYLHVLLPHQPWRYLPTGQDVGYSANDPANVSNLISWLDPYSAAIARERHLLQLQAGDALLGKIIARLKAIGAWDNSIVVVTADHGIAFSSGKAARSVQKGDADQILWTPLFIKVPHQTTGRIDDRPAQSVDVVPTIADLIGVKIPWHVDGRSLLLPPRKEFIRHFYQWKVPHLQPPHLVVAPGNSYLGFDPRVYFPKVLKARAAPAVGDPALRPYRIGTYGSLIGQSVSADVDASAPGPKTFFVQRNDMFSNINTHAYDASWTFIEGYVLDVKANQPLVFTVNGKVAGIGEVRVITKGNSTGFYWAALAPQFFHDGSNDVRGYAVSGPASHPRLKPLTRGR